jgi:hypothetical protein
MNLSTKSLLTIVLIIFSDFASGQDSTAKVSIFTDVEKAILLINDIYESEGSEFELNLKPGLYRIHLSEDFRKWNAKSFNDTLIIKDSSEVILEYKFADKILLDTKPQNVYVFDSDSLIGFTPLLIDEGINSLVLRKPGYSEKLVSNPEIQTGIKPEMKFIGQIKDESFYGSTLFKLLVGTAIALGAATAYYKLEADKYFDEYQTTGNPEAMEQTDKYDLISGITFVVLQIDFGFILYKFLSK